MKRFLTLLAALLVLSLSGCKEKPVVPEPLPPETPPVEMEPEPEEPTVLGGDIVLSGNSYWVAYEHEDNVLIDLTLREDGTARIREIENGLWLINSADEQNMLWTSVADGSICLYASANDTEPCCAGYIGGDGTLELERLSRTYKFRRDPMPEGGALYAPAELQGVWLQVSSEVEGDQNETMPGRLESLVFRPARNGDRQTLLVTSETRIYDGYLLESEFNETDITVLDQSLYSGCGNEEWSVRIGEESALNENGYPINTETYVTLLDQNTLLRQRYFSFDGGPGISYQTFKRFLPRETPDLYRAELEGCNFELSSYTAGDGTVQDAPVGVQSFFLHLDTQGEHYFTIHFDDGSYHRGDGIWIKGEGGTILLYSEENENDWFAGAVQSENGTPTVFLWYDGGIMRLDYTENDSDWGGYVDTMTDLEGNAFAAPENAVLIYYGDEYLDMDWYRDNEGIPSYELADGPDVRQILLSCAVDDTPVWIENGGFKIAQLGTMMAGESIIVQTGYDGAHLCFEYSGIEYYIELSQSALPLDAWDYITVG